MNLRDAIFSLVTKSVQKNDVQKHEAGRAFGHAGRARAAPNAMLMTTTMRSMPTMAAAALPKLPLGILCLSYVLMHHSLLTVFRRNANKHSSSVGRAMEIKC